ncbi:MAG: hypothetical protein ABS82_03885 [Rhodanobacter sp. SCN 67-45]|uniref:hypothetical protein n=1 Tax=Rhodanobacter thiooxydans TaxID=416169 RepID=UPI000260D58F|nr:hypothetical protein [Rhodanobacter thiooxydans]EIM03315.1 hypothetical protein UUA_00170 [Rhodanobacter thiooxydans LCS2]ODT96589.1 MAG: hypothetical protein ABS82_03885 [Rhodanobacter sp. SCN 67-45]
MKYLAGLYGVTVLLAAIYFDIWGQYAYRSFFFNLGRALVWPAIAFPTVGTILSGLIWLLVIGAVLVFVRRDN